MGIAGHYPVVRRAITITTANRGIRFREGAFPAATANVAVGTYYLRETGANALLPAIVTALEAATASTNTYSLAVAPNPLRTPIASTDANVIGTLTRTTGSDAFQILGADPLTTFDLGVLGFDQQDTALDASAKTSILSSNALWVGNDLLAVDEPDMYGEVFGDDPSRGGLVAAGSLSDAWVMRRWGVQYTTIDRVWQEETPADQSRAWANFWARWIRTGTVLEIARIRSDDLVVEDWDNDFQAFFPSIISTYGKWVADNATRLRVGPIRRGPGIPLYAWPLVFHRWVAP